ncbi:Uncharacterised protein [Mycobacteroides abscessus subsp. abscessus]|nr:Uncharacterised protein [Mycobacteroides abscessus subsp. abscessus]
MLGMLDTDEGDVVGLVADVLQTRDGRLELAGQVGILRIADVAAHDLVDRGGRVEDLVDGLARQRGAEDDARAVAARLGGLEADALDALPDRRDVLDANPVVLDVLTVGQIGGVAGELGGDLAQRAELFDVERSGVAPDAHHEVAVFEDVDVLVAGPGAVVALRALRVEAPPAHPAAQILFVDRVEALLGVDVLDAGTHVERVVVLLDLLVGVQRLAIPELPLALRATLGRAGLASGAVAVLRTGGAGRTFAGRAAVAVLTRRAVTGLLVRACTAVGRDVCRGRHEVS